jgi:hypothetical protein
MNYTEGDSLSCCVLLGAIRYGYGYLSTLSYHQLLGVDIKGIEHCLLLIEGAASILTNPNVSLEETIRCSVLVTIAIARQPCYGTPLFLVFELGACNCPSCLCRQLISERGIT